MVKTTIYLEGGGDSKELHVRCREGFRKLLERCGFAGRMPKLVACGGRGAAYDSFKTAHAGKRPTEYVAMLIDSEEPLKDIEEVWDHLKDHDSWESPNGADDDQILLMATCMETWIVCDRETLTDHYGAKLQISALPPLVNLEERARDDIQNSLVRATRNCSNRYTKGKRSFEILTKLTPAALEPHLPSFMRVVRILKQKL